MIDWDWIGNGKVNRWNANYNLTLFLLSLGLMIAPKQARNGALFQVERLTNILEKCNGKWSILKR